MRTKFGDSMGSMRHEINKETREQEFLKELNERREKEKETDKKAPGLYRHLERTGFFAQENIQEYNREVVTHLFNDKKNSKSGRGMFFDTPEELAEWMYAFFDLCARTAVTPTMSGLACWLKCDLNTLRLHSLNPNSPFYELCNNAKQYCHSALEIGATEGKLNSVAYIFQAKNYFNMRDQTDIKVNTLPQPEITNQEESLKALIEQQKREDEVKKVLETKDATFEDVIKANL